MGIFQISLCNGYIRINISIQHISISCFSLVEFSFLRMVISPREATRSLRTRKNKQATLYVARARQGPGAKKAFAGAGGGGRYIYVNRDEERITSRVCDVNTMTKGLVILGF